MYRDKGYFGVKPKGFDATMTKALRSFKLSIYSILRNRRISKEESSGRISICNNEEGIPLLTHFGHIVEKS